MSNIAEAVKKGTRYFIYCAIIIQTLFAIVWIIMNFGSMVPDHNAQKYLQAADSLIADDYMSIFYASILWIINHLCGKEYLPEILFVFQFVAVFFSSWCFPIAIKYRVLVGLYLGTCPFVLYSIASIDVYAFSFACFVAMIGCILSCRNNHIYMPWLFGILALFSMLLSVDYVWLEAILFIPLAFIFLGKFGSKTFLPICLWLFSAILAMQISMSFTSPNTYGRATKSLELFIAQYIPGEDIYLYEGDLVTYYEYTNEVDLKNIAKNYERFFDEFAIELESNNTLEASLNFYRYAIDSYLERGKRASVTLLLKEMGCYIFPFVSMLIIGLFKMPGTGYAWIVSDFTKSLPSVFSAFLQFSCAVSIVLACYAVVSGVISRDSEKKRRVLAAFFIAIVLGIGCTFGYIRGFDFRRCIVGALILPLMAFMTLIDFKKINHDLTKETE